MTDESTAERRSAASHWKRVGLFAGGLAVGYALVQERERVAGAVANVQDTLTTNGLTLMQKLSEMSDAFLAKVHETFVAAAPPKSLEVAVRHGLTGQPDDAATTAPESSRSSRTRPREDGANTDSDDAGDPAYQPEPKRRTRHTQNEQNVAPSRPSSPRAAGAAARGGWQASLRAQEAGGNDLATAGQQTDEAASAAEPTSVSTQSAGGEPAEAEATAALSSPGPQETDDTPPAATVAANGVQGEVAMDQLVSAQTAALAQRAQAEPASLLGAKLAATWVNETFVSEVIMIREGRSGRFEALVKYEADGVEQWEVLGEPPYKHTLIAEPVDTWLRTGSALVGAHTLECIDSREFEGVVMAWLPKRDGYEALYKIYHVADGDFEELDESEVTAAVTRFAQGTISATD